MKNIEKYTPLTVVMKLYAPDGENYILSGLQYSLWYRSSNGLKAITSFTAAPNSNTISYTFTEGQLSKTGYYSLVLELKNPTTSKVINRVVFENAFAVYPEGYVNNDGVLATEVQDGSAVITLSSVAEYGVFVKDIELYVNENGYWYANLDGTTRKPLIGPDNKYVSAAHTLEYDEDTDILYIDKGRVDPNNQSVQVTITSIHDALVHYDEVFSGYSAKVDQAVGDAQTALTNAQTALAGAREVISEALHASQVETVTTTSEIVDASQYAKECGMAADTAADYAIEQGDYAKEQGDYAKEKGDYAKNQGDYAKLQAEQAQQAETMYTQKMHQIVTIRDNLIAEEATRVSNETTRQGNEETRKLQEGNRSVAEIERSFSENTRVSNEETRQSNEQTRQSQESTRQSQEQTRLSNESTRQSQEQTRQSQESTRQSQESARQTTFNTNEGTQAGSVAGDGSRWGTFKQQESLRNQAAQTIIDTASQFTDLSQKVNEFEPLVEQIPSKADMDGHYDGMSVGAAENLIGKGNPYEGETFTQRVSGGSHEIEDGIAEIRKIKGNTLKLSQKWDFSNADFWAVSTTYTNAFANNVATIHVVSNTLAHILKPKNEYNPTIGHKYLFVADILAPSGITIQIFRNGAVKELVVGNGSYQNGTAIFTLTSGNIQVRQKGFTEEYDVKVANCGLFDLTEMGLESIETAEQFAKVMGYSSADELPYYPYNATPKLLNFLPNSISSKGHNLIDQSTLGTISSDGYYACASSYDSVIWENKNNKSGSLYVKYDLKNASTQRQFYLKVWFTDGTATNYYSWGASASGFTTPSNKVVTMVKQSAASAGTYYIKDFIISFGDYAYEPYEMHEMPLHIDTIKDADGVAVFPNGLLSAGTAYDEITKTHAVKRIGKVDLGTLTWNYNASAFGEPMFFVQINDYKSLGNLIQTKYAQVVNGSGTTLNTLPNKTLGVKYNGKYIYVRDVDYTSAATFKTAMNGVYLYYELETPKVIEFASELNLDYEVFTNGVEELKPLTDENGNPTTSPIIADIVYGIDYVNTIESNKAKVANHETRIATLEGQNLNTRVTANETQNKVDLAAWQTIMASLWGTTSDKVGYADLGSFAWSKASYGFYTWGLKGLFKITDGVCGYSLCTKYKVVRTQSDFGLFLRNDGACIVTDTSYSDAATFKTAMNGVMIFYEKA